MNRFFFLFADSVVSMLINIAILGIEETIEAISFHAKSFSWTLGILAKHRKER